MVKTQKTTKQSIKSQTSENLDLERPSRESVRHSRYKKICTRPKPRAKVNANEIQPIQEVVEQEVKPQLEENKDDEYQSELVVSAPEEQRQSAIGPSLKIEKGEPIDIEDILAPKDVASQLGNKSRPNPTPKPHVQGVKRKKFGDGTQTREMFQAITTAKKGFKQGFAQPASVKGYLSDEENQRLVIFLQKCQKEDKESKDKKVVKSVTLINQAALKNSHTNMLIKWDFFSNNYEDVLVSLFEREETKDQCFDAKLLYQLIYAKIHDTVLEDLCESDMTAKKGRPVVAGLKQLRKTLFNDISAHYCSQCAAKTYQLTTKHWGNCTDWVQPSNYKFLRVGQNFICALCTRMFPYPRALALHLCQHAWQDLFFLGYNKKTLANWEDVDDEFKEIVEELQPPSMKQKVGTFPILNWKSPGWIAHHAERMLTKQEYINTQTRQNHEPMEAECPEQQELAEITDKEVHTKDTAQELVLPLSPEIENYSYVSWFKDIVYFYDRKLEDTELRFDTTTNQLFMAAPECKLRIAYTWRFLKLIRGGVHSLFEGLKCLHFVYERNSWDWFLLAVEQRAWGLELLTNIGTVRSVRAQTFQSIPGAREDALDDYSLRVAAFQANKLCAALQEHGYFCTDLWRPCFWVLQDEPGMQHMFFTGFHTVFKEERDYWSRRTMDLDRELGLMDPRFHSLEETYYDQRNTLVGMCLLIVTNGFKSFAPQLQDTTGTSTVQNQKEFEELAQFLNDGFKKDQFPNLVRSLPKWLVPYAQLIKLVSKNTSKTNAERHAYVIKQLCSQLDEIYKPIQERESKKKTSQENSQRQSTNGPSQVQQYERKQAMKNELNGPDFFGIFTKQTIINSKMDCWRELNTTWTFDKEGSYVMVGAPKEDIYAKGKKWDQ